MDNGRKISDGNIEKIFEYINNAECYPQLWNHIINNPQKSMELIFESTGSHYYSAINNRYNFIANIFQDIFKIDFQKYMKNSDSLQAKKMKFHIIKLINHYLKH